MKVEFWRKPDKYISRKWHAFERSGRFGYQSVCGDIFTAHTANAQETMPRKGRCGKCVRSVSAATNCLGK